MIRLSPETPQDADEVELLLDLAFAPGRRALSSYALREGVAPVAALCAVARDDFDALAGCIRCWPVRIGLMRAPALLLGPIAVHPTRQGEGIGALLIGDTLRRAGEAGWLRALLVGDAAYYRRFGFEPVPGLRFPPPTNPARVLARALAPGAWDAARGDVVKWSDPPPD